MTMYNNNVGTFSMLFNKIEHFETSHNKFSDVNFPNNQINISKLIISDSEKEKTKKLIILFHSIMRLTIGN